MFCDIPEVKTFFLRFMDVAAGLGFCGLPFRVRRWLRFGRHCSGVGFEVVRHDVYFSSIVCNVICSGRVCVQQRKIWMRLDSKSIRAQGNGRVYFTKCTCSVVGEILRAATEAYDIVREWSVRRWKLKERV